MVGFRSLMRETVLNANESRETGKLRFYHGIFCGIAFHRVIERSCDLSGKGGKKRDAFCTPARSPCGIAYGVRRFNQLAHIRVIQSEP